MKPLGIEYRYQCGCGVSDHLTMYFDQWYCLECLHEEILNKDG